MMRKRHNGKNPAVQRIAKRRIEFLIEEARKVFKKTPLEADKYIGIARRISMKYKVKIDPYYKKSFCKNCHKFILPGVNCRVRIHKHRIIYYCISCKNHQRMPIK